MAKQESGKIIKKKVSGIVADNIHYKAAEKYFEDLAFHEMNPKKYPKPEVFSHEEQLIIYFGEVEAQNWKL